MEPITLCGLVIVMFGLWVEFEPKLMAVVEVVRGSKFFSGIISHSTVQKPVYVKKMTVCATQSYYH